MAKNSKIFHFGKTLGNSYAANLHKQGVPEAEGENDISPLKGIDTLYFLSEPSDFHRRNDTSPLKGIDTNHGSALAAYNGFVEMVPVQKYQLDLVEYLWYINENFKKTKNLAKTSQFFPFRKTLGKSHTASRHKQGAPEAEGRNGISPLKGIDTQ